MIKYLSFRTSAFHRRARGRISRGGGSRGDQQNGVDRSGSCFHKVGNLFSIKKETACCFVCFSSRKWGSGFLFVPGTWGTWRCGSMRMVRWLIGTEIRFSLITLSRKVRINVCFYYMYTLYQTFRGWLL